MGIAKQSEYPTIADELHRKTLDAIAWLAEQRECGLMDEHEFHKALQAVHIAVGGLVPHDVYLMLSHEEPRRHHRSHLLYRDVDGRLIYIRAMLFDKGYQIFTFVNGEFTELGHSRPFTVGSEEADNWLANVITKLQRKGFKAV